MKTGSIVAALVAVLVLPVGAGAAGRWWEMEPADHQDWTIAVTAGARLLRLDGDFTVDESLGDTDVSIDGVLDLDEVATVWAEIDFQPFSGHHLRFAYTPIRFDETEVLDAAITVDGVIYNPGNVIDAELRFDQYEISYRYEFQLGDRVSIAPLLQVTLVDARVHLENETTSDTVTEKILLPLPYLGLRFEAFPLTRVGIFAEGKGFTIGSEGTIWEASAGVSLHLTRHLSILGRYRISDYEVEYRDSELDFQFHGPTVAATVRF